MLFTTLRGACVIAPASKLTLRAASQALRGNCHSRRLFEACVNF